MEHTVADKVTRKLTAVVKSLYPDADGIVEWNDKHDRWFAEVLAVVMLANV
jgi:hypothetical protein